MMNFKKKKKLTTLNEEDGLINYISPMSLMFSRNDLIIGENKASISSIIKYPSEVNFGWLGKITNIPNTVVSLKYKPINTGEFLENVASTINRNIVESEENKDAIQRQRASRAVVAGEKIIESLDSENESIGSMSCTIMNMGENDKKFEYTSNLVKSRISASGCKLRILANMQKESLEYIMPYYHNNKMVENINMRVMPLKTFVGGVPFATNGYTDGSDAKYIFANDLNGGLVALDIWKRDGDRTNSNFAIFGVPGVGKSTVVKFIAINEFMTGTTVAFIDPEAEYVDFVKSVGGIVIDAGGGSGVINPLQIRNAPTMDEMENDEVEEVLSPLANHLQVLDVFFNLYFEDISITQKAILKDVLIDLYKSFGITWDTDIINLKNTDYPIMKDLRNLVIEKEKSTDSKKVKEAYNDLAILLKDIAEGGDSFLFGKHSTIKTNAKAICFNTYGLQGASDRVKKTQYFNILTYAWEVISRDRKEKALLFCDEAYLMIDERVPQALIFLRNSNKRARKYEAGIGVISHAVGDFIEPKIKQYGQALLDNPTYKILMGTDGKNLEELKNLYNLTEAEESFISAKARGKAVLMVGSSRLPVNFVIPKHKLELMGSAGGR